MKVYATRSGTLSEYGYLVGVAAEISDISAYPLQGGYLIFQTVIAGYYGVTGAQES